MSIGSRLVEVRKTSKLGQLEFSEKFGVSASAYRNYERGINEPPVKFLVDVSEAYGIDIGWLIKGEGAVNAHELILLVKRSAEEVENFLVENGINFDVDEKSDAVAHVFEYLSAHPDTSKKFMKSILDNAARLAKRR